MKSINYEVKWFDNYNYHFHGRRLLILPEGAQIWKFNKRHMFSKPFVQYVHK